MSHRVHRGHREDGELSELSAFSVFSVCSVARFFVLSVAESSELSEAEGRRRRAQEVPSAQKSSCGAAVAVGAVLVGPDKKMPRPRWPRRRTGMILGLAERIGVIPGIVIPVPGAIPRVLPDSRSTYATVTQNLSRIVSCFRSERLAGVVSRLTTDLPRSSCATALTWGFAIRAKNQPTRRKTVDTSTTPQADQLGGIIPKRVAQFLVAFVSQLGIFSKEIFCHRVTREHGGKTFFRGAFPPHTNPTRKRGRPGGDPRITHRKIQ